MTYNCGPSDWSGYGGRRYYSREERKQWLESYANELEAELKAVRERIKDVEATA